MMLCSRTKTSESILATLAYVVKIEFPRKRETTKSKTTEIYLTVNRP